SFLVAMPDSADLRELRCPLTASVRFHQLEDRQLAFTDDRNIGGRMPHQHLRQRSHERSAEDDRHPGTSVLQLARELLDKREVVLEGCNADHIGPIQQLIVRGSHRIEFVANIDNAGWEAGVVHHSRDVCDSLVGRGQKELPASRHTEWRRPYDNGEPRQRGVGFARGDVLLTHLLHELYVSGRVGGYVEKWGERGYFGHDPCSCLILSRRE